MTLSPIKIIDHFLEFYKCRFTYTLTSISPPKKKREIIELKKCSCEAIKVELLADQILIKESTFIGGVKVEIRGTLATLNGTFNGPIEIIATERLKIEVSTLVMRNVDLKFLPTTRLEFNVENFSLEGVHLYTILADESADTIRELFLQQCDSLDEFYFHIGKNRI